MVEKLFARLKFQKELQNYATTDDRQDKNNLPPIFDLEGIK